VIPITRPELPPLEDFTELLNDVWDSRMLSNFGPFVVRLERLASDYLGVAAKVVVSGDVGLTLAIAALDLPKGSKCLVPAFTFNSTVNAIIWNGLVPVFVDIDHQTLNFDVGHARTVASDSPDVRLIVATHVFGNPADTDALKRLAESIDARLIFDAAHGYGSKRNGIPVSVHRVTGAKVSLGLDIDPVGQFGDAEVFSLSGTKV
jgi:dTDP-4-amino-4,6-dideoxygalactose transaminase